MLINAMEVTGIEGNYRTMCESVMKVMREHKDSVMAVLEAFVYDPLLNWRLMDIQVRLCIVIIIFIDRTSKKTSDFKGLTNFI